MTREQVVAELREELGWKDDKTFEYFVGKLNETKGGSLAFVRELFNKLVDARLQLASSGWREYPESIPPKDRRFVWVMRKDGDVNVEHWFQDRFLYGDGLNVPNPVIKWAECPLPFTKEG